MGVYIWSRLPSEYQEVEYIQSSGSQYINTGKTVSGDVKIDYTYMPKEAVSSSVSCGLLIFMDNEWRNNGFGSGNTYIYYGGYTSNNEGHTVGTLQQDVICHDIVSKSGCSRTINGNTVSYVPQSSYPSPSGTLKLFVSQRAGSIFEYWKTRMYSFKRYDSGVLTQDMIPCYRKSDSVIGLYDLVNNQFYTNSGSGTFSKGSDVNTYRESSMKNAYIGEYKIPTSGLLAYRPLVSDANDHKADLGANGTTYNGTWGGTANYGTVGGKTAALFTRGSNRINTGLNRSSLPISICACFYHTTTNDWETIIGNPTGNNKDGFAFRYIGSSNAVEINNGTGSNYNTTTSATSNTWHSVVMTIESGNTKVYLDGNQVYTLSSGNTGGSTFYIASFGTYTTYGWNGYIGDVCIYNRVLTADEALIYHNCVI